MNITMRHPYSATGSTILRYLATATSCGARIIHIAFNFHELESETAKLLIERTTYYRLRREVLPYLSPALNLYRNRFKSLAILIPLNPLIIKHAKECVAGAFDNNYQLTLMIINSVEREFIFINLEMLKRTRTRKL